MSDKTAPPPKPKALLDLSDESTTSTDSPRRPRISDVLSIPSDLAPSAPDPLLELSETGRAQTARIAELEQSLATYSDALDDRRSEIEGLRREARLAESDASLTSQQMARLRTELRSVKEATKSVREDGNHKLRRANERNLLKDRTIEALQERYDVSSREKSKMAELHGDMKRRVEMAREGAMEEIRMLEGVLVGCIEELPFAARKEVIPANNVQVDVLRRCVVNHCGYGYGYGRGGEGEQAGERGDEEMFKGILGRIEAAVANRPDSWATPIYYISFLSQLTHDPSLQSTPSLLPSILNLLSTIHTDSIPKSCERLVRATVKSIEKRDGGNFRVVSPRLDRIIELAERFEMGIGERDGYIRDVIRAWKKGVGEELGKKREGEGEGEGEAVDEEVKVNLESHFEDVEEWCINQNISNPLIVRSDPSDDVPGPTLTDGIELDQVNITEEPVHDDA